MIKLVTAAMAAGTLCITSAAAGPLLGGSMMASQSTPEKTASHENRGILAYFVEQLSVSITSAARTVGFSAEEPEDRGTPYSDDNCDAEPADESEPEDDKSQKFEQAGPEPIYFGF